MHGRLAWFGLLPIERRYDNRRHTLRHRPRLPEDTRPGHAATSSLVISDATDENLQPKGDLRSSTAGICDSDGGTLMSSNLAGTGYGWPHVWQDGTSGDNLGIDSMRG
jgi:hypothetical protein